MDNRLEFSQRATYLWYPVNKQDDKIFIGWKSVK